VETRTAQSFIRYRVNVARVEDRLADATFALQKIPSQTLLVLQGGGAMVRSNAAS
jgi:NTE family protein